MPLLAAVLLALLAGLVPSPRPAEAAWRQPVDGVVVRAFRVGAHPFAAGQHRGVDFAARPGAPVRAACSGTVRFAGAVPRRGRVVSVACGRLVATHLGLAATTVRRGDRVLSGARIGSAAGRSVQLGARRRSERFGYVDPLALIGEEARPPLGAAPAGRPDRVRRRPPGPRHPSLPPTAARYPALGPRAAPSTPVFAWGGVVLLALGLPAGGLVRRRRRAAAALRPARTS